VKPTVKIYVEGGGHKDLNIACRRGFNQFFQKTRLAGTMPKVLPCGSRNEAYKSFCNALTNNENALLLVDSEAPIQHNNPWEHLKTNDQWQPPKNTSNENCHLMVQIMETWFLADIPALTQYFGQGFNEKALPHHTNIEEIPKSEIIKSLNKAAKTTKKKHYDKSRDSFSLLANLDPNKVTQKSPWAMRLINTLTPTSVKPSEA